MSRFVVAALALVVFAPNAPAVIDVLLRIPGDDRELLKAAYDADGSKKFRNDLDRLVAGLLVRRQPEIEKLLGKPTGRKAGTMYDMPLGHYWGITLSGLHSADPVQNKNHIDFHPVGDV